MKILSINKSLEHHKLAITNIQESELKSLPNLEAYSYIIINGGDGTIRRVVTTLHTKTHNAKIILNPTGSFNVIAKLHKVPKLDAVLHALEEEKALTTNTQQYYQLNEEVFLFSAGNMGDLHHIFLAETLRFGFLKNGILKYALSIIFLLPLHLLVTPFMLLSSKKFFIFTPASFIPKFGSFYGNVKEMKIDLENGYNFIELDGDVVTIEESILEIAPLGSIDIVSQTK